MAVKTLYDISGMVGLWNYNGPAILNAVRDAGKVGRVRIITFDEALRQGLRVADASIMPDTVSVNTSVLPRPS